MLLIHDICANNARRHAQKTALIDADRQHSWSQTDERARRLANVLLERGLQPGDRVVVIARNCIEWPEISFGLSYAGLIAVPANIRLAPGEVTHILNDSGASAAIVHSDQHDRFAPVLKALGPLIIGDDYERRLAAASPAAPECPTRPDDLAVILYTSGTTGRAKGVMHSHRGLLYQAADTNLVTEAQASDVMLATTPFFTAGGMLRTVSWLYLGQTMVIHQRFDPERVLDEIEQRKVTFTTFIPTMLQRTLALVESGPPRNLCSLRRISYGSAPVPPGLAQRAMTLLGCDLQQRYGLTECGGQATILTPQDHRDIVGGRDSTQTSCGRETPMCAIRICDADGNALPAGEVGEIVIESPANAIGYWNQPEQTAVTFRPDGVRTGDMGYLDADNYLHVTGRKTDMIISGGFNVYPAEIERVIGECDGVELVAVVGVPDAEWGETPVAVVVPHVSCTDVDELTTRLTATCRERLAGYKQPRRFVYRHELPLGPAGKILKGRIRDELSDASSPHAAAGERQTTG